MPGKSLKVQRLIDNMRRRQYPNFEKEWLVEYDHKLLAVKSDDPLNSQALCITIIDFLHTNGELNPYGTSGEITNITIYTSKFCTRDSDKHGHYIETSGYDGNNGDVSLDLNVSHCTFETILVY